MYVLIRKKEQLEHTKEIPSKLVGPTSRFPMRNTHHRNIHVSRKKILINNQENAKTLCFDALIIIHINEQTWLRLRFGEV